MTQPMDDPPAGSREDRLQDVAWHGQWAQPALIALQAACLAAGLWVVILAIAEDPALRPLPLLFFAAALAGVSSAIWLDRPAQRLVGKTTFILAQLVVILAAVRLFTWMMAGWPGLADLRGWMLNPLTIFDGFFLAAALLCALAWHRASVVADIFYRLALSPGELAYDSERRSVRLWRQTRHLERALVSRSDLVEQYVVQWLMGGVFLAILAAATRIRIGGGLSINVLSMGIPPQMAVAAVLYFLIGLVLLSQARLAVLRAQWLLEGVEMSERLPARWGRLSLALMLGVGLVAALLPLGSTWHIGAVANAVAMVFVRIALLVVALIAAIFALIANLFDPKTSVPEIPQDLVPVPPAELLQTVAPPPPWLGGAAFWVLMLLVLMVALRLLLGKEGLDVTRRKLQALLARLWINLTVWTRSVQARVRSIPMRLPRRQSLPAARARQPWRFIRVGGLPPREQVRYFYLSTLRRASDQGIVRRPAQTPQEFLQDLEQSWPEAELDVEALTAAFVVARYDVAEISPDEAHEVKSVWERIKRALRGKRKSEEGAIDELH